jgi:hypothetical protein
VSSIEELEELENDPSVQAIRLAAKEKARRSRRITLGVGMLIAAFVLLAIVITSMAPMERGDAVREGQMTFEVGSIKAVLADPAQGTARRELEVVGVVWGPVEQLTDESLKALALKAARKAAGDKFTFSPQSPGLRSTRGRPELVVVRCAVIPMERVPDDVPTLLRRMPSLSLDVPASGRLTLAADGTFQWSSVQGNEALKKFLEDLGPMPAPPGSE